MESRLFPPSITLSDDTVEYTSSIPGLCIARNEVERSWEVDGQARCDIRSYAPHVGGHFVTHSPTFTYQTFGIHVGQIDRLTFVAHRHRLIEAYFIDCRKSSPTCGHRLHLRLTDSPHRRLCIPCGVAHTFSSLEDVVTRNDLSIFVDPSNASWDVLDDDLSFWWTEEGVETAPSVKVNTIALPEFMVRFFYRLQKQAILAYPEPVNAGYSDGELIMKGCRAVRVPTKSETDDHNLVAPSTDSCEMGFFTLHLNGSRSHGFHSSGPCDTIHTFLDREGEVLQLEVMDACDRFGASEFTSATWTCNPSLGLLISAGVQYRYVGTGQFAVREEHVLSKAS